MAFSHVAADWFAEKLCKLHRLHINARELLILHGMNAENPEGEI